ncbi:MAG: protein translocase subunit SecD [Aeoliella sp.]
MKIKLNARQMTAASVLLATLFCSAGIAVAPALAQDEAPVPAAEEAAGDELPLEDTTDDGIVEPEAIVPADEESPEPAEGALPAVGGAAAAPAAADTSMSSGLFALILLALFVVPAVLGNLLGKNLGMPDHGWKISLALGTVAAAALAIAFAVRDDDNDGYMDGFKLGPDLGGGVTLVYDLADPDQLSEEGEVGPNGDQDPNRPPKVSMDAMRAALKRRLDPSGVKEVTIRSRGKAIEIIIPKAGQAELTDLKKKITELGQLEFRILVDRRRQQYQNVTKLAEALPPSQTVVKIGGQPEARWVTYNLEEFGGVDVLEMHPGDDRGPGIVKRQGVSSPEILVFIDPFNVTGEHLNEQSTRKDVGPEGFEVRFEFNALGAKRFGRLTGKHVPNPSPYYLGILLDDQLLTAPSIRSKIDKSGTISGQSMGEEEVDHVVSILQAGSLPAELNETPVSEAQTGPEIGALTIQQGKQAMIVSLSLVLLFILFYYRFAGLVACLALATNLLMVLGAMVAMNAAFTLPGLAGLVLTVGMSVDANVLIFERIREELARGSTLRMAIRNGFGRATTTIVDANLTTLITGIVLWVIGTDQIKGFAVTLIFGIIMSMYTAIFCSRILFDIAERKGWITKLVMMRILSKTNLNFIGKWPVATALSVVVIGAGLFGVATRQMGLLNIDFTGGTSVTMVLKKDAAMPIADVRSALLETELADRNLLVVARDQSGTANTAFKVDCNVLDEEGKDGAGGASAVERVEKIIAGAFPDKLETHLVTVESMEPFIEGEEGENQYQGVDAKLRFGEEEADESIVGVTHDAVLEEVNAALEKLEHGDIRATVTHPLYSAGSSQRFRDWTVRLGGLEDDEARKVIDTMVKDKSGAPIFPLANKIGRRVAGDMRLQAISAILVSLLGIIGYIWIRFQKISYGLAAVVALVHDVLVTLGVIALSAFAVTYVPSIASALQINAFQISLPIVAAFLTIIGYSLNDTIVVFDRVREVRGKSPDLTADMINTSVNQTLSRTILTSLTTLLVVVILYLFGGDGIHAFAFALVVGVIVGTYSSIFVASPVLLWLSRLEQKWSV